MRFEPAPAAAATDGVCAPAAAPATHAACPGLTGAQHPIAGFDPAI
jgi:hypothetical protein